MIEYACYYYAAASLPLRSFVDGRQAAAGELRHIDAAATRYTARVPTPHLSFMPRRFIRPYAAATLAVARRFDIIAPPPIIIHTYFSSHELDIYMLSCLLFDV